MKKHLMVVALLLTGLLVAASAEAGGLDCLKSEAEVRLAHNEGDFSRIGRVAGEVPRYHIRNTACGHVGRFAVEASLNSVIGQKWSTVHTLGSGTGATFNPETYTRDLSAHMYADVRVTLGYLAKGSISASFRNSIKSNLVADHLGIVFTRNWLGE